MEELSRVMLKAALDDTGECSIRVHGCSMVPFIRDGDLVCIKKGIHSPVSGRCVAFFRGDQLIVHRIICKKKNGMLVTAGDSSVQSKSLVSSDEILGTVVAAIRSGKQFSFGFVPPLQFIMPALSVVLRLFVHIKVKTAGKKLPHRT